MTYLWLDVPVRVTVLSSCHRLLIDRLLRDRHDVSVITIKEATHLYPDVPVQAFNSLERIAQVLDVGVAAGLPHTDAVVAAGEPGVIAAGALRSYFSLSVPGPGLEVAALRG